jgi:hypothetical protein
MEFNQVAGEGRIEVMMERMWKERLAMWIVDKLPKSVVYFCGIRLWVKATTGKYSGVEAPGVTMNDALKAWENEIRKPRGVVAPRCKVFAFRRGGIDGKEKLL